MVYDIYGHSLIIFITLKLILNFFYCFFSIIGFESGSTPFLYSPFCQVPLTDVCHVAMKHFNGHD
jgi:hypothetical protein